jgi:hypothetical protein
VAHTHGLVERAFRGAVQRPPSLSATGTARDFVDHPVVCASAEGVWRPTMQTFIRPLPRGPCRVLWPQPWRPSPKLGAFVGLIASGISAIARWDRHWGRSTSSRRRHKLASR